MKKSGFAYHAGTWIPFFIVLSVVLTIIYASVQGLTWERPVVYAFGILSLVFGVQVLLRGIQMDQRSGQQARFYPLALLWTGVSIALLLSGLLIASVETMVGHHVVPEAFKFGAIVGGVVSIAVLSLVSFYGGRRGILAHPADPVPLRSVIRAIRRRRK